MLLKLLLLNLNPIYLKHGNLYAKVMTIFNATSDDEKDRKTAVENVRASTCFWHFIFYNVWWFWRYVVKSKVSFELKALHLKHQTFRIVYFTLIIPTLNISFSQLDIMCIHDYNTEPQLRTLVNWIFVKAYEEVKGHDNW